MPAGADSANFLLARFERPGLEALITCLGFHRSITFAICSFVQFASLSTASSFLLEGGEPVESGDDELDESGWRVESGDFARDRADDFAGIFTRMKTTVKSLQHPSCLVVSTPQHLCIGHICATGIVSSLNRNSTHILYVLCNFEVHC
jgi:hypothetical protein